MKTSHIVALSFIAGVVVVCVWLSMHNRCPACQERWAKIKNRFGSKLIEPRPPNP